VRKITASELSRAVCRAVPDTPVPIGLDMTVKSMLVILHDGETFHERYGSMASSDVVNNGATAQKGLRENGRRLRELLCKETPDRGP